MSQNNKQHLLIPLALMGTLFFIFGFVTWLNGILIPYLQIACELTNFQAVFVAFSFYISYTVMALPSSRILERIGFKSGIMIGLMIMAIAGGAILPLVWGWISDISSAREAYLIVVPAYTIILFYAIYGYNIKTWKIQ